MCVVMNSLEDSRCIDASCTICRLGLPEVGQNRRCQNTSTIYSHTGITPDFEDNLIHHWIAQWRVFFHSCIQQTCDQRSYAQRHANKNHLWDEQMNGLLQQLELRSHIHTSLAWSHCRSRKFSSLGISAKDSPAVMTHPNSFSVASSPLHASRYRRRFWSVHLLPCWRRAGRRKGFRFCDPPQSLHGLWDNHKHDTAFYMTCKHVWLQIHHTFWTSSWR